MIELDKRIISGKKPLTCFDAEQARNFVGKKCYLTNDISLFSDLNEFKKIEWGNSAVYEGVFDTLTNINTEVTLIFETSYRRWKFCIPCEWVKEEKSEPKYRPYTMKEFIHEYAIGESIFKIRDKRDPEYIYQSLFIAYSKSLVYLGGWSLSLEQLFDKFEIGEGCGPDETWHPFGILEE